MITVLDAHLRHRIGHRGLLVWAGRAGPNWEAWGVGTGMGMGHPLVAPWAARRSGSSRGSAAHTQLVTAHQLPPAEQRWAAPIIMLCLCPACQGISSCISQLYLSALQHLAAPIVMLQSRAGAGQGIFTPCLDELAKNFIRVKRIIQSIQLQDFNKNRPSEMDVPP